MRRFYLSLMLLLVSVFVVSSLSYGQSNVALNKNYSLSPNSGEGSYADAGGELTNGVSTVVEGQWDPVVGFYNVDPVIVVDLGSIRTVEKVELYFFYKAGLSFSPPQACEFLYSLDGVNFTSLLTITSYESLPGYNHKMFAAFSSVSARYIKLSVVRSDVWLALSEVMVYAPNNATKLVFVQQPSDAEVGQVITPFVTVQLKDDSLNNVLTSGVPVDISLSSGSGVLSGTLQRLTDLSGLATFLDLSINQEGLKNLTALSSGLMYDISNSFSIVLPSTPTPVPPTPTPTQQLFPTPTPTSTSIGSTTVSFGGVVYGRVVDKFKSPLPEIKVLYSTQGDEYLGKNPVLTDNDGYYYFEDVDTQFGYGLVMTGKRYGTITLNYGGTVKDSVVRVPDKMLVRGNSQLFTLSGTVKDLYLSPVEHARVRVKSSCDPRVVYTDSLGAFSVSDLFIGTYTVTVKHSGYYPGRVKYFNTDGLDGSVGVSLQEK